MGNPDLITFDGFHVLVQFQNAAVLHAYITPTEPNQSQYYVSPGSAK